MSLAGLNKFKRDKVKQSNIINEKGDTTTGVEQKNYKWNVNATQHIGKFKNLKEMDDILPKFNLTNCNSRNADTVNWPMTSKEVRK